MTFLPQFRLLNMPARLVAFMRSRHSLKPRVALHQAALFSTTPHSDAGNSNPPSDLLNNIDSKPQRSRSIARPKFDTDGLITALKRNRTKRSAQEGTSFRERGRAVPSSRQLAEIAAAAKLREMESQLKRPFRPGNVYSPHDLSAAEINNWRNAARPSQWAPPNRSRGPRDVFDRLGINPIKHYKNFALLAEYVSEMGRIKHARLTGLRPVNQRKISKAIRRAIGIGIMPSVHYHPELWAERMEQRRYRSKQS